MDADGAGQRGQIIPALKQRHEPAAGACVRHVHQSRGSPREILLQQIDLRERVALMGVKARRDNHEIGAESDEPGQDRAPHRLPAAAR